METVQLISLVLAVLFFIQVIFLTSRGKLQDQQAFMWLVFAASGMMVAAALPLLNRWAALLGISYMPSLIFLLTFFVVISLLIYHTIIISKQQEKLKTLAQEFAYLKKELAEVKQHYAEKEKKDVTR
ncbi:DUF2304 domain-containing protein [Bacillus badius]|uniref:DUF2304 domain-containing protein n=1 Tax=Bacillus badius TaxID=1455 RepID=UPI002E1A2904|nr:DUF2304 domain-containing protein [Bacillus badius]